LIRCLEISVLLDLIAVAVVRTVHAVLAVQRMKSQYIDLHCLLVKSGNIPDA
jgi:hypothetical protein